MSGSAPADALEALLAAGTEPEVRAVMWATVDAERALAGIGLPAVELPDDRLLGASVRLVRPPAGEPIALLEPLREGRLTATLARAGEGPAGRYVVAANGLADVATRAVTAGIALSRTVDGPFGPSVLVTSLPAAGPHLILVERPAGTIES